MARSLALALLLVVAATTAFLIWRPGVSSAPRPDPDTSAVEQPTDPASVDPRAGAVTEADPPPTERRPVEAAAQSGEPTAHTGKRVRVVDAATGAPVADATVWFLSKSDLDGPVWNAVRANAASADPMGTIESHGRFCGATGPDGEVRIPELEADGLALVGAADPLGVAWLPRAGWTFVGDDTSDPILLEIGRQDTLTVRVVDARGNPAPGSPLRFAVMRNGYWMTAWRGVTGADGTVRVPQVGQRARVARGGPAAAAGEAMVFVDAPLGQRPRAVIDLEAVPEEPVVLALPETGSITVAIEGRDPSRLLGARASLLELGLPLEESALARGGETEVVDGRAVFPLVGLGLRLRASVGLSGANEDREVEADGPRVPGQEVIVRVPLVDDTPILVARLVDPDNEPLASQQVQVVAESSAMNSTTTAHLAVETDADGRVFFTPTDDLGPDAKRSLRFRSDTRDLLVDAVVPRPLKPGENDLGTLRMTAPPLLMSGRVVDDAGTPIAEARIRLQVRIVVDPDHPDAFYDDSVDGGDATSDDDGEFTIHGVAKGTQLTAFVEADGYLTESVGPLPKGTRGVVIKLSRAGAIRGEVRVPHLGAPIYLRVTATHTGSGAVQSESITGGAFELASVEPGRVDVAVALFGRIEPVARVHDVVVASGRTTELDAIDLTSALRKLAFRVVDPNGAPIRDAHALWVPAGSPTNSRYEVGGVPTRDGHGEIVVPDEPVDLFVYADHHRSQQFAAVRDGQELVLPPAPVLVLRVAADAIPSGSFELRATARAQEGRFTRDARYVLRGPTGTTSMAGSLPWDDRLKATVDAGGTARFELPEPGNYAISWSIRKSGPDGGARASIAGDQVVTVRDVAVDQIVDAALTKELVETALREGF